MLLNKNANAADCSIGMTQREIEGYNLLKVISTQIGGYGDGGIEREASNAVASIKGKDPLGLYIPSDVLNYNFGARDLSSTNGGGVNLIGTDHRPDSFVGFLHNNSVISQVGATILNDLIGDVDVPRQDSEIEASWIDSESYAGTDESTPSYSAIHLTPKTLRTRIDVSRRILKQAQPRVEKMLRFEIGKAIGQAVDKAAIAGSGVAPEPQGILGATGVNIVSIDTNGGPLTHGHLVAMETALGNHQQLPGKAYVGNINTQGALKTIPRDTIGNVGGFLMADNGQVNGYPSFVSNNLPNDLTKGTGTNLSMMIFGAWSSLLVGMWGGIDLEADKVTLGDRGAIVLRAFMDVDIALQQPGAFTVISDITT